MVTFPLYLSVRWLWLCMWSVRILYARSQLYAKSVGTLTEFQLCHVLLCKKMIHETPGPWFAVWWRHSWSSSYFSHLVLPAALHWRNVLSWAVNWGSGFSWETVHQERMAPKESHICGDKYISKTLNQIKPLHLCSVLAVQFIYLVTGTVPITVIAEIFTAYSCDSNVVAPVLQMRSWGRETWRTWLEKWAICGQEEAVRPFHSSG